MSMLRYRAEMAWRVSVPEDVEADVVRRWMILRKLGRVGILHAECGRYWVSMSEYDPHGSRWPVSVAELKSMVEAAELAGDAVKKPVMRAG